MGPFRSPPARLADCAQPGFGANQGICGKTKSTERGSDPAKLRIACRRQVARHAGAIRIASRSVPSRQACNPGSRLRGWPYRLCELAGWAAARLHEMPLGPALEQGSRVLIIVRTVSCKANGRPATRRLRGARLSGRYSGRVDGRRMGTLRERGQRTGIISSLRVMYLRGQPARCNRPLPTPERAWCRRLSPRRPSRSRIRQERHWSPPSGQPAASGSWYPGSSPSIRISSPGL